MMNLKPITFRDIEEGKLAEDLDAAVLDVSNALIAHVAQYGVQATKKDKAKLTLEITFEHLGNELKTFGMTGKIKRTLPGRPATTTLAIHSEDQLGEGGLFVRVSGSDDSEPHQMKLATKDGRAIDQETGEAIDKRTSEVKPSPKKGA